MMRRTSPTSYPGEMPPPERRRQWDPRPLLGAFVVLNAVALASGFIGLLLLLPLVIPAVLLGPGESLAPPGSFRTALLTMTGLFALILVGHSFDPDLAFDPAGIREGAVVCLRLAVLYASAATLTSLAGPAGIAMAVRWIVQFVHPGVADRVFHMMVLVFRFLPRLWEIAAETRAAAKLRSPRRFPVFRGTVTSVIYRFVVEADRATDAATVRRFFAWAPRIRFEGLCRSSVTSAAIVLYCVLVGLVDSGAT